MSMTDPIADMFTRIRNAAAVGRKEVSINASKMNKAIATVLKDEGYIVDFEAEEKVANRPTLTIKLKYFEGQPVIERIERISRPGLRIYRGKDNLPKIIGGLGIAIISTSTGVVTDKTARERGVGGEVIGLVA